MRHVLSIAADTAVHAEQVAIAFRAARSDSKRDSRSTLTAGLANCIVCAVAGLCFVLVVTASRAVLAAEVGVAVGAARPDPVFFACFTCSACLAGYILIFAAGRYLKMAIITSALGTKSRTSHKKHRKHDAD